MRTKHKTYKLQDDSIEVAIQSLQAISARVLDARSTLAGIAEQQKAAMLNLQEQLAIKHQQEERIIELMRRKNKKSIVVARVRYYIEDNELKKSLVLD